MSAYFEDIDEDLDEMDDESDDEGLAERRRKRRQQPRGGRYTQPRTSNDQVKQNQLQAALLKVGDDIKKLNANQTMQEREITGSVRKLRQEYQNFAQMSLLLPLLVPQKTVEVTTTDEKTASVLVKSDSSFTTLLPLMLFMQPADGNSNSQSGSGNLMSNPLMLLVLLKVLEEGKGT